MPYLGCIIVSVQDFLGKVHDHTCKHCYMSPGLLPCFPDNKTGLVLIFTSKYGTRAYFRGMYYFDISKNEVTK